MSNENKPVNDTKDRGIVITINRLAEYLTTMSK